MAFPSGNAGAKPTRSVTRVKPKKRDFTSLMLMVGDKLYILQPKVDNAEELLEIFLGKANIMDVTTAFVQSAQYQHEMGDIIKASFDVVIY